MKDFVKKKVKLGRKVKRANVTEIKVKSSRIILPNQSQMSSSLSESTSKEAIQRALKQLHHYSESSAMSALNKVKEVISSGDNVETLLAMVVPEIMELIFKEDAPDARKLANEILIQSLTKFKAECFAPIFSVMVTYMCSGLTHIHRVRSCSPLIYSSCFEVSSCILVVYLQSKESFICFVCREFERILYCY